MYLGLQAEKFGNHLLVASDKPMKQLTSLSPCSNVVYHGEMAKKSEMERKRAEPNDENEGEWYGRTCCFLRLGVRKAAIYKKKSQTTSKKVLRSWLQYYGSFLSSNFHICIYYKHFFLIILLGYLFIPS